MTVDEYDTTAPCPECGATVDVCDALDHGCPECSATAATLRDEANDPADVQGETPESQQPSAEVET